MQAIEGEPVRNGERVKTVCKTGQKMRGIGICFMSRKTRLTFVEEQTKTLRGCFASSED